MPTSTSSVFFFFFNDTATTEIYTLFPTRRSSDLASMGSPSGTNGPTRRGSWGRSTAGSGAPGPPPTDAPSTRSRSEEHTSELQSRLHLVCRLLLEKKKTLTRYDGSTNNTESVSLS